MVTFILPSVRQSRRVSSVSKWWLAVGRPDHWQIAFEHGSIWGLKATSRQEAIWQDLSTGDHVLFYATRPVAGVIGHGVVRTKFRQHEPLWPQEVKERKVIWPNRFELDVAYCLPQNEWAIRRVAARDVMVRAGFQPVAQETAEAIIEPLISKDPGEDRGPSLHEEIKRRLVETGRLQRMIAETEYRMDGAQLDVVWRRVEKGAPTYVFEVQIGGDLQHAIGKLKHAHDLWNSNIFLVLTERDALKADQLLAGTFHEIRSKLLLIEVEKVYELFKRKKALYDFEAELGIC